MSKSDIVKVENDDGRLRLRFTHAGKRYSMAIGLPDSKINQAVAQQKATQIELDIASGNFDPTLKKYKTPRLNNRTVSAVSVGELFTRFMEDQRKAKSLHVGSLCRYTGTLRHLEHYFQSKSAESVDSASASGFREYLKRKVSDRTAKDYIILIQACWNWAKDELPHNPWTDVLTKVKPAPKQKVKPFSAQEVQAIQQAFAESPHYQHYADFIAFLFGTACRFGEAVALKWEHISDDFSTIWIGESVSRGVRKTTKTGKDRTVHLSSKVSAMLRQRKQDEHRPSDLVFPAPQGGCISDHTFRRRAWKSILAGLEIDYRKPYATRHTAISHALANGANPLQVAEQTGHDPEILFKHYASVIQRQSVMVEF